VVGEVQIAADSSWESAVDSECKPAAVRFAGAAAQPSGQHGSELLPVQLHLFVVEFIWMRHYWWTFPKNNVLRNAEEVR
jgi:hypothetical protein